MLNVFCGDAVCRPAFFLNKRRYDDTLRLTPLCYSVLYTSPRSNSWYITEAGELQEPAIEPKTWQEDGQIEYGDYNGVKYIEINTCECSLEYFRD